MLGVIASFLAFRLDEILFPFAPSIFGRRRDQAVDGQDGHVMFVCKVSSTLSHQEVWRHTAERQGLRRLVKQQPR